MRGSLVRRCVVLLTALAMSLAIAGTAGAASSSSSTKKLANATLNGSGATFPYGFYQVAIGAFKQQQHSVTINYQAVGSGQGRTDFNNQVTDFGASDAVYSATATKPSAPFLYFPTVVAPITVSYNLPGVKTLNLSADTIAKIFQTQISTWDDPAIKAENPKAKLPSTTIAVAHRSDGSGTTENFTSFLTKAAPTVWTLGKGSTVSWAPSTQGGNGNTGVANLVKSTEGAIGYVDYSDAVASGLTFAAVKNAAGKYVKPTVEGASAAADGAAINADLTYDPINSDGVAAYPITAPTWLLVYTTQKDAAKGAALKGFLNFIYSDGQKLASSVDYAPLSKGLVKQAKKQINQIVLPTA